jgi:hypothetical protein
MISAKASAEGASGPKAEILHRVVLSGSATTEVLNRRTMLME